MARLHALLLVASVLSQTLAVDRSKFHTCQDTGFCRRHRGKPAEERAKYYIDSATVNASAGTVSAAVLGGPVHLQLSLNFYNSGVSRFQLRESNPLRERWQTQDVILEHQLTPTSTLELLSSSDARLPAALKDNLGERDYAVLYGVSGDSDDTPLLCHLTSDPLTLSFFEGEELTTSVNGESMLHFEHHRARDGTPQIDASKEDSDRHGDKEVVGYWEDGLAIYADGSREERRVEPEQSASGDGYWEERIKGHSDSKPHGPSSVGLDVVFHGDTNKRKVFGLPEHATRTALPHTNGPRTHYNEPYRLYNLDVFEYELDEPMALYGAIPLVVSHGLKSTNEDTSSTVGALWLNPSETFVDVGEDSSGTKTIVRWISESGIIDLFLLPGSSPRALYQQYGQLTGTQELPPLFSLGYHQCRWNYKNEDDVASVHQKFEELDFPYDVLWLDIEHTDGKRYFTWDKRQFKHPVEMQQQLSAHGRRMVTIVDPHIKRDNGYYIYKEGHDEGFFLKDAKGKEYDGYCWPGGSGYLDFTSSTVRGWWAQQFALDKYKGSTVDLFTWNDMNEPSVFNGPEVSMSKDATNIAGIEHREWHNLYGQMFHRSTAEGLVLRHLPREEVLELKTSHPSDQVSVDLATVHRPFVLSRAFFAGSQRFGAIWTGDNAAKWSHLQIAAPMLLGINIGGLSFAGADVGGFFGNPSEELMTRWHQAASYQPFFRGHAHLDSKRREPWVFGEPTTSRLRAATMARYALLPFWYTTFYEASVTGFPVMRAMWLEFPQDVESFGLDDQWMIGNALLVKPVVQEGHTSVEVYFPGGARWYDIDTLQEVQLGAGDSGTSLAVDAPIDKIPVFQRGGTVVPRKLRLRRSSKLMKYDPLTLTVALDSQLAAKGQLYVDDEHTFAYWDESGAAPNFYRREFAFSPDGDSASGVFRFTNRASTAFSQRVSHTTTLHDALLDSDTFYGHSESADGSSRRRRQGLISSALNAVAGIFHSSSDAPVAKMDEHNSQQRPRRVFHSSSATEAGIPNNEIERLVIVGFPQHPSSVFVDTADPQPLEFRYEQETGVLTIRQPKVDIGSEFDIVVKI